MNYTTHYEWICNFHVFVWIEWEWNSKKTFIKLHSQDQDMIINWENKDIIEFTIVWEREANDFWSLLWDAVHDANYNHNKTKEDIISDIFYIHQVYLNNKDERNEYTKQQLSVWTDMEEIINNISLSNEKYKELYNNYVKNQMIKVLEKRKDIDIYYTNILKDILSNKNNSND